MKIEMKNLLAALSILLSLCCAVSAQSPGVPNGGGTNLQNPLVVASPEAYQAGTNVPVSLDTQGGLILATGLHTPAVTCSSACTTFGSNADGVLFTLSTWPYGTVVVEITSAGTGTTLSYQVSSDHPATQANPNNCVNSTNWLPWSGDNGSSASAARQVTSATAQAAAFSVQSACFRVIVTAYGSGTVTVGATQSAFPLATRSVTASGNGGASTPAGAGAAITVANNPYPSSATAITGNATGTTGAVVGTLATSASVRTYICGFNVSAIGGTAAVGPITIAGTITSSMVYQLAASASGNAISQTFTPCVPASANNTTITITTTADGTASAVSVNSWGFQL